MGTETAAPRYRGLESWNGEGVMATLFEAQLAAVASLQPALPSLTKAAEAAAARLKRGGRLAYAGAGTSARLAAQDGAELHPTFGWSLERMAFLIAGGTAALMRAVEGAEDDVAAARAAVKAERLTRADVLVAVSASGRTPYTLAAAQAARKAGALVVGIANNTPSPLLKVASHPVLLLTGAEPIAGSTRMKAGTAQKAALTLFSTLTMIRLGRVHEGRMVDVVAGNAKLRARALEMVRDLAGVGVGPARRALAQSGGHIKLAVLVARGLEPEVARELLAEHHDDLGRALGALAR
ncbi:MAG: N-acetylmuramic acid 6-phosphate etherase [Alphaproteobacteria bacterium]|nr:N-acetylmuramic acid 6-phosphate etherase [Alphaproteobacteria bacterium]